MKKRLRFSLTFTCLLLCWAGKSLFAQFPQTLEIGPHVGISTYQGDINPLKFFSQPGYEYGGLVRYNLDSRWAFRADYTHAVVRASDRVAQWRPDRDAAFRATIHAGALLAEFNFLDYYTGRIGSSISPYLYAGVALVNYTSGIYLQDSLQKVQFTGITPDKWRDSTNRENRMRYDSIARNALLRTTGSDTPSPGWAFSIPFGLGCKFSLTQHLGLTVDWRMYYTFTDNLDGLLRDTLGNALYPGDHQHQIFTRVKTGEDRYGIPIYEYSIIEGDLETVAAQGYDFCYDLTDPTDTFHQGQQRGDASTNDWFGVLTFSITWKIPIPGNSACKIVN